MAMVAYINPIYFVVEEDFLAKIKSRVKDVLSSGASSDVILAQSTVCPSYQVAMKVLTLSENADIKNHLFRQEIVAMNVFNHYHLMKARYAVRNSLRLYISMQFYSMGTLDKHIRGLDFTKTELFLVQLASAVKHMHDHKFVHTDIKLSNILLAADDRVLLADFGLSFQMSNIHDVVNARNISGTVMYQPPEKLYGDVDALINPMKLDMYSLGVVLAAMVYRLKPEEALHGYVPSIRTADVPPLLLYCMENLLKQDPAERFSSKQLMDVLLERSQWKQKAKELEETFVAVPGAGAKVRQDLYDTDALNNFLQIRKQNRSEL